YWSVSWVSPRQVFAGKVVVFALKDNSHFAVLNSAFHTEWAEKTASRLKEDPAYSLADTFETFPFPSTQTNLNTIGERYYEHRSQVMLARQEGLTKTYNRFHDQEETSADIQKLRQLHVEMDHAVAAAYGWTDLDLGHGFHPTKQGLRYTISEAARREVLGRLLKLNHERYAEEVAKGLHGKKKGNSKGRSKKKETDQPANLFEQ